MFAYLLAIAAILVCLCLGQWLVLLTGAPLPGALLGMLLLLLGLLFLPRVPHALGVVAQIMLRHLVLWLLPSVLGVLLYLDLLRQQWLPLAISSVLATAITAAVTAWVFHWLSAKDGTDDGAANSHPNTDPDNSPHTTPDTTPGTSPHSNPISQQKPRHSANTNPPTNPGASSAHPHGHALAQEVRP